MHDIGPPPKGALVAVGGNEDKVQDLKVLRTIVGLPEGGSKIVEILPTASSIPREVAEQYVQAFGRIGIPTVRIMDVVSRADAMRPEFVQRIRECDVVFITGGDQLRLTSLLGGSPVLQAIRQHYWNGGVVAGTSAGAAAMSSTMIFQGEASDAMKKGTVQMTSGLGLVRNAIIDTHFIQRGRLSRLLEVVASNPGAIGLGVGEDTGIIITDGHRVRVIGAGVVVVVDGHHLRYSNITEIQLGHPIAVEQIVVHTLVEGHGYDLLDQRYLRPGAPAEARPAAQPAPPAQAETAAKVEP